MYFILFLLVLIVISLFFGRLIFGVPDLYIILNLMLIICVPIISYIMIKNIVHKEEISLSKVNYYGRKNTIRVNTIMILVAQALWFTALHEPFKESFGNHFIEDFRIIYEHDYWYWQKDIYETFEQQIEASSEFVTDNVIEYLTGNEILNFIFNYLLYINWLLILLACLVFYFKTLSYLQNKVHVSNHNLFGD